MYRLYEHYVQAEGSTSVLLLRWYSSIYHVFLPIYFAEFVWHKFSKALCTETFTLKSNQFSIILYAFCRISNLFLVQKSIFHANRIILKWWPSQYSSWSWYHTFGNNGIIWNLTRNLTQTHKVDAVQNIAIHNFWIFQLFFLLFWIFEY